MRTKTVRLIIFFVLTSVGYWLTAQEITFYDSNWTLTSKDKAQFYFVTVDNYPAYRMYTLSKYGYGNKLKKYEQKVAKKVSKKIGKKGMKEINFQTSVYDSVYIGKSVKVFSAGDIYDYLCESSDNSIDWPSNEIKQRTGVCYEQWKDLKDGAFGKIVWKFNRFNVNSNEPVFLIQFDEFYIPIRGNGLTLCNKYSRMDVPIIKESFFYRLFHKDKKQVGQM